MYGELNGNPINASACIIEENEIKFYEVRSVQNFNKTNETDLFPFLIEIENNWPEIFKNFSILNDSQIEIIENWN